MGLHSPFGYVDYEWTMAKLFAIVLSKLCAHCHTDADYAQGCHECPAGHLVYACRDYLLESWEGDQHFLHYTTERWIQVQRVRGLSEEDIERQVAKDRQMAEEYKPESDVLRVMKKEIEGIEPVSYNRKGHEWLPTSVRTLRKLTKQYQALRKDRLRKWGLPI